MMGAERERIAGFGPLEAGLLEAGEWYWWGPYVSERHLILRRHGAVRAIGDVLRDPSRKAQQ
jgi:hypothetical protein